MRKPPCRLLESVNDAVAAAWLVLSASIWAGLSCVMRLRKVFYMCILTGKDMKSLLAAKAFQPGDFFLP